VAGDDENEKDYGCVGTSGYGKVGSE
jgi:hypothetical protein